MFVRAAERVVVLVIIWRVQVYAGSSCVEFSVSVGGVVERGRSALLRKLHWAWLISYEVSPCVLVWQWVSKVIYLDRCGMVGIVSVAVIPRRTRCHPAVGSRVLWGRRM